MRDGKAAVQAAERFMATVDVKSLAVEENSIPRRPELVRIERGISPPPGAEYVALYISILCRAQLNLTAINSQTTVYILIIIYILI